VFFSALVYMIPKALDSSVRTPFMARIYVHVLYLFLFVNVSDSCLMSPAKRLMCYFEINAKFKCARGSNLYITLLPFFILSTALLFGTGFSFSLVIYYTVGRTPWTGDQPAARPVPTQGNTNTEQTHTNIYVCSGIRTQNLGVKSGRRQFMS
jgi:hypothetical protein